MRLLFIGYYIWSFSHYPFTDDRVVYTWEWYLDCSLPSQNTWSVWNTLINKDVTSLHSELLRSNLAKNGAKKHKPLDVTEGVSATKSLKCLGSNEDAQHKAGDNNQSQRQREKVSHKMAFSTVFPVLYSAFNYLKIYVPSKSTLYPQMLNQRGTCTPKSKCEWECYSR